jgi:hypothetical protein
VDTKLFGNFQQLRWPGISAAEVSPQGSQGGWLPDAVPQPHEIHHCAQSIVDADGLAGGRLDAR